MKNIFNRSTLLVFILALATSCEWDTDNFAELSDAPDPSATYYLQFKDGNKSLESEFAASGDIIDIETTIVVSLLGLPQSQDVSVNLAVDPASTVEPEMYNLSNTSVTIPAGSTSGSITLTTNTELMPEDEFLQLILDVDAGENTATAGTKLTYDLKRAKFCALDQSVFVGNYSGSDANGNPTKVVVSMNADGQLELTGVAVGWMTGFWGEIIITQNTLPMEVNALSGAFTITEAPYMETTYLGDPQDTYNLVATGKIDACTGTLFIDYDLVQGGSGLAGSYGPFEESINVQ